MKKNMTTIAISTIAKKIFSTIAYIFIKSPLLKYPHSGAALGIYTVIGLIVYYLYTTIYYNGI